MPTSSDVGSPSELQYRNGKLMIRFRLPNMQQIVTTEVVRTLHAFESWSDNFTNWYPVKLTPSKD